MHRQQQAEPVQDCGRVVEDMSVRASKFFFTKQDGKRVYDNAGKRSTDVRSRESRRFSKAGKRSTDVRSRESQRL